MITIECKKCGISMEIGQASVALLATLPSKCPQCNVMMYVSQPNRASCSARPSIKFHKAFIPLIKSGGKTVTRRLEKKGDVGDVLHIDGFNLKIRLLDVREEHLIEISEEDCMREGVLEYSDGYKSPFYGACPWMTPISAFCEMWGSICDITFYENPLVWRHEFEVVR